MQKQLTIVAGVLLAVVVVVYACWFWFGGEALESPGKLAQQALTAPTLEEQQAAAARLATVACLLRKTESQSPAREPLLQVLRSESTAPTVRAVAIPGLMWIWDYQSMDLLLAALDDPSVDVQNAARQAVVALLELDATKFPAVASADERQKQTQELKARWADFQKPGADGVSKLDACRKRLAEQYP